MYDARIHVIMSTNRIWHIYVCIIVYTYTYNIDWKPPSDLCFCWRSTLEKYRKKNDNFFSDTARLIFRGQNLQISYLLNHRRVWVCDLVCCKYHKIQETQDGDMNCYAAAATLTSFRVDSFQQNPVLQGLLFLVIAKGFGNHPQKRSTLRMMVGTLQKRGVNDSVCHRMLLDLQTTSFEILWSSITWVSAGSLGAS